MESKPRIRREVDSSPLSPIEQTMADQIVAYYKQMELYNAGKLAKKPNIPECSQQIYKDMYNEP